MDHETREFLTKQFQAIDQKFEKIDSRLDGMDARFDAMDSRLDAMQEHIDTKTAENRRHFEVVAESLRTEIQQVAEGHQVLLNGQARIVERMDQVERELGAMIKFSYADLDRRIRGLEEDVSSLASRVERLEAQRD